METLGCPEIGGAAKLTSRYGNRCQCPLAGLELEWCQHTERRVSALTVVEDLQVLEERGGQLQARGPGLAIQQLDLHPAPERLHQGVVETCPHSAHRGQQARLLSPARERPRAVLPGFKGSSQHRLPDVRIGNRSGLRPESSTRAPCAAGR